MRRQGAMMQQVSCRWKRKGRLVYRKLRQITEGCFGSAWGIVMKKISGVCAVLCLSVLLSGCGNKNMVKDLADNGSVSQGNKRNGEAKENTDADSSVEAADEAAADSGEMVDLTVLNSTMVYSEVYDMVSKPEDYIGKRVKMAGLFSVYEDEKTKKRYFSCIIQDATACCAQGLEFELKDARKYPEEYPEMDSEITVVGTFDTYEEDGNMFCVIRDAQFT